MYHPEKLKKVFGEKLREHVSLRDMTSIHIGGVCDYFVDAKTIDDLITAIIAAKEDKIPYFILGGGSNILISDFGFPGLVIKNSTSNISILPDKSQIIADSGVNLGQLILRAISVGLGGLEPLYGIYGTLGGAVYGNAGAYGVEIFNFIKNVTLLNPDNKIQSVDRDWFEPTYRSSKLKKNKKKDYVILTIKIQLAQNKREQLLENLGKYKGQRDDKFKALGPSCGSIFKNPIPGKAFRDKELAKRNSAGYLLESIGAKNIRYGDAGIYQNHANIIENKGQATAREVRVLVEELKEKVKEAHGKNLQEEIEYVGQWE